MEEGHDNDLAMGSKRYIDLTGSVLDEPLEPSEIPLDEFDVWQQQIASGHSDAMWAPSEGPELNSNLDSWIFPEELQSAEYDPFDENYEPSLGESNLQGGHSDTFTDCFPIDKQLGEVSGLASGLASSSQAFGSSVASSSYNKDVVVDSAWTSLSSQTLQPFWENDFWQNMMSDSVDPVDLLSTGLERPAPVVMHESVGGELEVSEAVVKKVPKTGRSDFTACVKDILPQTWKEERESQHQTAIFRWHAMLLSWHDDVDICCALQCRAKHEQLQILVDIFYNKAPSTLMKRVRSLSRVTNYFLDRGMSFPCTEEQMYSFLCSERDSGAAASRMKSTLEACVFARHVLGVTQFDSIIDSRRCSGTAASNIHKTIRQSTPLTVDQLRKIHDILSNDPEEWNRAFA